MTTGTPFAISSLMAANIGRFTLPILGPGSQCLCAVINRCSYEVAIGATIHGNDLDVWHSVNFDGHILPLQRRARKDDTIIIDNAEDTEIARLEGFDARRMSLSHIAGRVDWLFIASIAPLPFD